MCGRYRLSRRKQAIDDYFSTDPTGADWTPRYNIAPTQNVAIVRQDSTQPTRTLSLVRWGLIPSWIKGASIGSGAINARAETAASKPSFSEAIRRRRCLIPADGFYEWQRTTTGKQPYCFEVGDNEIFAFAGLWEQWRSPEGTLVLSGRFSRHRVSAWSWVDPAT
jgi:putative SOS response-associated peptidase YedK